MKQPELKDGELYVGTFGLPDGTAYQCILLPGDNDITSQSEQLDWAKSIGGDLPDRVEQAFLYKYFKDQFQEAGYWSNTTKGSETGWAWYQNFEHGYQTSGRKDYKLRARAVRRVYI